MADHQRGAAKNAEAEDGILYSYVNPVSQLAPTILGALRSRLIGLTMDHMRLTSLPGRAP